MNIIDEIKKFTDDPFKIAAIMIEQENTGYCVEEIVGEMYEENSIYGVDRDFSFYDGDDEVDVVTSENREIYLRQLHRDTIEIDLSEDLIKYFDIDKYIEDKVKEPLSEEKSVEVDGVTYYGYYY